MEPLHHTDPRHVGSYRLLRRLSAGGMGRVYLAESPGGRQVAVKVMRPELTSEPLFHQRFKREVDAARLVGGYHTAQVIDADPDAEPPWMATAYIPGPSLQARVQADGPFCLEELRSLTAGLAEGLTAIHASGLVHRDLKPRNILMASDGPRIIDFGVARPQSMDVTALTVTGDLVGTPSFMSPEQIDSGKVGPPTDVFSLGGVVVFAATGRFPFGDNGIAVTAYAIVNTEPDLDDVPAPLRDIVRACMAKNPAGRPTAAGLLTAISGIPRTRPEPPPDPTMAGPRHARVPESRPFPVPGAPVSAPGQANVQVRPATTGWSRLAADPAGRWLASADADGAIAVWDAKSGLPVRSWYGGAPLLALAAGPDDRLASAGTDGLVRVWDAATGTERGSVHAGAERVDALAFDRSGTCLATGQGAQIRLWDVAAGHAPVPVAEFPCDFEVTALAFGPDARVQASATVVGLTWDDSARTWIGMAADGPLGRLRAATVIPATGTSAVADYHGLIRVFPSGRPAEARYLRGADIGLRAVATIGSGEVVAMVGTEGAVHLWHRRLRTMRTVVDEGHPIVALAVSPDETRLAVCDERKRVALYDIVAGSLVRRWRSRCPDSVSAVAFRPDGERLATAGVTVRTWEAESGEEVRPLPDSAWSAWAIAYDQSGHWLAAAGADGTVRVWDGGKLRHTLTGHRGTALAVAFGPAGGELEGHLITAGWDETIRIWDLGTGEERACLAGLGYRPRVLAVDPLGPAGGTGGGLVAVGCADGSVRLCRPLHWRDAPALTGHIHEITAMCFTGTGASARLVTASRDGTARVWRLGTRQAELMLVPGTDGWAAAESRADGTMYGYGETEGRIWHADALSRISLPGR